MVTVRSRRLEYSESTRQALVDSAVELFTKKGYANTSLDAIARRARVTKGALYHHFSGKQALFEAAFDAVETSVLTRLTELLERPGDPWQKAMDGAREYIKICLEPTYQRIVIHEGPVVMGWERWREAEDHFSFGLIKGSVEQLVAAGLVVSEVPVEVTARLLFGALSAAATMIAEADDQKRASTEAGTAITQILESLRLTRGGSAPAEQSEAGDAEDELTRGKKRPRKR
jgi:AcrR family transcriptional regulator